MGNLTKVHKSKICFLFLYGKEIILIEIYKRYSSKIPTEVSKKENKNRERVLYKIMLLFYNLANLQNNANAGEKVL